MQQYFKYIVLLISFGLLIQCKKDQSEDQNEIFNDTDYPVNLSVGYSAKDILQDNYSTIKIEINCFNQYPESETITEIYDFIQKHTHKTHILIQIDSLNASGQQHIDEAELRSLDELTRNHFTENSELVINCNYFDSKFVNENTLGVAFYNTSIALFGEKINSLSDGPLEPPRWKLESTVFLHELGHLMGLVNNGTEMVNHHQDVPNGHHCTQESCLMYWAMETSDVLSTILQTDSVLSLGAQCHQDIANNGGK